MKQQKLPPIATVYVHRIRLTKSSTLRCTRSHVHIHTCFTCVLKDDNFTTTRAYTSSKQRSVSMTVR